MKTWQEITLGEVLTFQRGFDITKSQQQEGSYFVISSSGPQSTHNEYKVEGPGIVIGRKGTLGSVYFSEKPFWPHDTTLWVKDFHSNDPKFAYYFLQTLHLEQYDVGAANPSLNRNHIHLIPVNYPPFPIQRKIAEVLSAYDDLIEINARRIRVLEAMAQSVYREWFGKVDAKSLPKGWELGVLEDALILQRGFDLPKQDRKEGDVPIYASTGITGTHVEAKVKGPGVITGRSGSLGTVIYVEEDYWPLNTTLWVKEFRRVTPLYAYYLLKDLDFSQFNSGAAVPTLNRNDVHGLPVIIPSKDILSKFDEFVLPLYGLRRNLTLKNANLRRTRDLLLPRLVSGEVVIG